MFEPGPPDARRSARSKLADDVAAEDGSAGPSEDRDSFVLYRIIGNDLVPRHRLGQSRTNLRFLLENEPRLANCEKRWVVNRIVDAAEEAAIVALLKAYGQPVLHIPFVADEYRKVGWDLDALPAGFCAGRAFQELEKVRQENAYVALCRLKNSYIMNNNGARNAALADGRRRAKWVLPWDGNCFVTEKAWNEILTAVAGSSTRLKYFVVPMQRLLDNGECLQDGFEPKPLDEPQLVFRRDALEEFDSGYVWDRRPKVELLWRLGVPGPWDGWTDDPWDRPRPRRSPESDQFGSAGWVVRLFSGIKEFEERGQTAMDKRGAARREAIVSAVFATKRLIGAAPGDACGLAFYSTAALNAARENLRAGDGPLAAVAAEIVTEAERTLGLGPYSVTDKSLVPPSGDLHDYCSPAPYWWPDPDQPGGLPYILRDGLRVPAAELFSPDSGCYDRTRLQVMVDGTTSLALAWYLTGRQDFAARGALFLRTWFLDPSTRMSPHLMYTQIREGHSGNRGNRYGIIEFKDIYYVLDAVRLLERSEALTAEDGAGFRGWLSDYLEWLECSEQGREECSATNNHGTYFDLQVAAIKSFLGDGSGLGHVFLRAMSRMVQQFEADGGQPMEIERSISKHYVYFNLQGWLHLLSILKNSGYYDLDYSREPYPRLVAALTGVCHHIGREWPHRQVDRFDEDRLLPMLGAAASLGLDVEGRMKEAESTKARFDPHSGVAPYWQLALRHPS